MDVTSVTDMNEMFMGNNSFNGNISSWVPSSVQDMESMFEGASSFNVSINSWNTSSVTNMESTFQGATAFNQSIIDWDTSSVTPGEIIPPLVAQVRISLSNDVAPWNILFIVVTLLRFVAQDEIS